MQIPLRLVNLKGELFSSTFTYAVTAVIKLGSSLVLTRMLSPAAYGIFNILLSLIYILELVSDVGTRGLLIRHPRGNDVRFIHTLWTVRLLRSVLNFSVMFLCAPIIAGIYNTPVLTSAFRTLSIAFLLSGAESMSFVLATRDQRARISNYAEMISTAVMTIAVIGLAHILRNHFALIYGTILQRALLTIGSYFFYRDIGIGIAFDRETVAEQFKFARFVLPSSLLYILVSQYDKLVLLKLFNLTLLGIYGIASNMIAPISGLVVHNAQIILYARCAEYFRTDRSTACSRYYRENRRLLMAGALLPAILAGFSPLIVAILYDPRYILAGHIAMILGLGAIIGSFQNASENLLVASGRTHTTLVANVFRVCSLVPATLLGYFLFGFDGYLWFGLIATIPVMGYYYSSQKKYGLLNFKSEIQLLLSALLVFLICLGISHLLLRLLPTEWLHLRMKSH